MDDAIESLQRAERAFRERGRVNRQTWLTMAWCYQKKGDVNNARRYAQEAASQPVRTVFDRIEQQKLEKLLGEL